MTASVIQENRTFNGGAGTTAATTLSNVVTGNTIHVLAMINSSVNINSITDDQSNTYTLLETVTDVTNNRKYRHAAAYNATGAVLLTITATFSASTTSGGVFAKEIGGVIAAPIDGHTGQTQATPTTGTDATTSGTTTSSNQPALVSGFCHNSANTTAPAAGTGFTSGSSGSGGGGGSYRTESKRVTATGSQAATFTAGSNVAHNSFVAVFDEIPLVNYTLTAATGTFALSGAQGSIDSAVAAQKGTFGLTGFTTTGQLSRGITASRGLFGFVGFPATLTYNSVTPTYVLLNDAITLAVQAGLMTVPPYPIAYSLTVPYGYVIAQSPAAGASVPPGTRVTLIVSAGFPNPPGPTPAVQNVLGMRILDAEAYIEANGCNVNPYYRFQYSNIYAQGTVMAQTPAPGGPVPAGTVVNLTVSLGIGQNYYGTGAVIVPLMH